MAIEYLFDFGTDKIKLCLVTGNSWVELGPGRQWLSEELANNAYLKRTRFRPIEQREVVAPTPVKTITATANLVVNPIQATPSPTATPVPTPTPATNEAVVTSDGTPVEAMPVETQSDSTPADSNDGTSRTRVRART